MELSAQRVRSKARAAVRRREDEVEQDEIESGELNLIPYLDMVTNLLLFLLASISTGIIFTEMDTTLPDRAPPSTQVTQPQQANPDDQPLKLVVSVTRDRMILWSISGLEGTLTSPKATFPRTGREGEPCDGAYMCESDVCDPTTQKCVASTAVAEPVYDYRALSNALFEIANRRYTGKQRKKDTYQIILMADGSIPYGTLAPVMAAIRCKMPDFGKASNGCALPTDDPALKKAKDAISPDGLLYDTDRAAYDPKKMALFSDILFSSGFEMSFTQREARRIIRKAVGRVPEGEAIRHLNIMPMMDMMTILLVAFVFQISTSALDLEATAVSLPKTVADAPVTGKPRTIVITPTAITSGGKTIVPVSNGDVDASYKEGGSLGVKIPRLTNYLASLHQLDTQQQRANGQDPAKLPEPELLVLADRTIPYRLLIEVMFSAKAKEAGYKHFRLIVQKNFPVHPTP